jgi:hypothetical protein
MKVKYLFEKDKIKKKPEIPYGAFESSYIVSALKTKFPFSRRCKADVHIADEYYFPVSNNDITDIFTLCKTLNIPLPLVKDYKVVIFDCDDFSFYMKGLFEILGFLRSRNYCFGVIWVYSKLKSYGHALNFYIDDAGEFMFFEPQTHESFSERIDDWYLMELKV